jgi:1,2-diacylglycerol 3-alpha-glucosyltransferase
MRIGIAASGLSHINRGVEAWAAYLAKALFERGEFVRLYKGSGEENHPYERVVPCWQRTHLKGRLLLRLLPKRFFWRLGLTSGPGIEQVTFGLKLLRHLRRDKIDILHVQDPLLALLAQRANQMGLIQTRTILGHGTEESLDFQKKITYLQHLAPWHLEEAKAAAVWKPAWTAIPNFIDTEVFHPGPCEELRKELSVPPDALVVFTAAAIKRHHKRIDYLLDEFASFSKKRPDLQALLIVAGAREKDTDELIERGRQLGERVRFLVNYPLSRMSELYRLADLFVLCSVKEMCPIVLMEATATAIPCVIHHFPVTQWIVGAGGMAIDMERQGALAEAMESLLSDDALRKELGRKARQHCVANFSSEVVIDQYLDYYRFVLAQGSGPIRRPSQELQTSSTV